MVSGDKEPDRGVLETTITKDIGYGTRIMNHTACRTPKSVHILFPSKKIFFFLPRKVKAMFENLREKAIDFISNRVPNIR